MKSHPFPTALLHPGSTVLLLSLLTAFSASAATLVSDSFTDGNRTTDNPPSSIPWYIRSANAPTNSTSTSGISLTPSTTANPGYTLVGYFAEYTLAAGETITSSITINAQAYNQLAGERSQLRFGMFNSGTNSGDRFTADGNNTTITPASDQGSFVNINLNSSYTGAFGNGGTSVAGNTDTIFWDRALGDTSTSLFGSFATNQGGVLGFNTNPFSTLGGTDVTLSYSITNIDGTNALYDFKINGTTFTSFSGNLTISGSTYDTFAFQMLGQTGSPFTSTLGTNQVISNITVGTVPEPSAAALLIAGLFGIAAKRRRTMAPL